MARTDSPLLERAVARAEIASLVAERDAIAPADRKRRQELERRIVAISTAERVLSPFTALLVLETAEDYARFGIDRKALADILTVRDGNLATLQPQREDARHRRIAPDSARATRPARSRRARTSSTRASSARSSAISRRQDESGPVAGQG